MLFKKALSNYSYLICFVFLYVGYRVASSTSYYWELIFFVNSESFSAPTLFKDDNKKKKKKDLFFKQTETAWEV